MTEIGISLLCAIFGFVISFLTFQHNTKKDIQKDTKENETKILFKRFERLDDSYRIRDELERGEMYEHSRKHHDRKEDND